MTGSQIPNVEVVATAATEKAFRAGYSAATKTIYFDRDFLTLTTPEELMEVYLEELGHYWQSQTEGIDIVGDEGALLAALILEKELSETEKQQISQEDDRRWLFVDGQWLAIEQASWLQTEELQFAEGRPGIFYLPETDLDFLTTLGFQAKEKDASYGNEIGFYLTDAEGRINGINPGEGGYTEAVLRQAERRALFNPNSTEGNWQEVELEGGTYFGLYLVADGSGEKFLNLSSDDPNRPKVYFSDTSANSDGVEHMRWQALGNGIYTVRWEDLWGGGDNDFNDALFTLGQKGIKTPGNSGQLVPFNVDWVSSDASYANEMGLYYVDDARGMINGIAPGDPRYAQEVFKAGNYQTLFEQGTVGGNQQITLAGGQYIGLYLISNSNRNDFLRLNPTNAPGAGPVAYFSYQRANPSDISYLSHYSGAQLGWEDFLGGGDKDYNDLIFNLGFGSPRNIRADVESVNITEGDSETKTAEITISLSEAHQNPVSLNYQTIDGTAKANDDYLPASGILTFAVGETQKRFSVSIVGDLIDEADEFLTIQLGDPRNVVLETSEAFITIYDNDKIADLPVNHPPIADEDKTITLQEDSQPVALNINSPSDSDDDPLTITVIQLPDDTKGRITLADGTIVSMGDEITLESLTSLRYAPLADANGDGGDFVYTVTDGNGGSDSQTISFIITPVDDNPSLNNPPVADADKTITLDEDSQPIELNINSPTDIDNDTLTIAITQLPDKSKGRITLADSIIINEGDEITIASLTSLIYTPLADANGNGGDFVYTVTDGKGGSNTQRISFVIQPSNLIVSAIASNNAPEFTTNPELEIVAGNNYTYDANAVDADNDTLFYSLLLAPQGLTIDHSTGIITWESPTLGNYNISILVEDGKGGRDTQTYTLGVVTNVIDTPLNRPPVFVSTPVIYGNLNTEYRYDANATDVDNDNLTYRGYASK